MEIRSFATTAVDKLGRRLPLSAQPPGERKPRLTALFYFLWNGEHGDAEQLIPKNVSAILREEPRAGYMPDAPLWGGPSAFYYWGEPLYGYYLSRDPWVMSRHVELFVEAGIDVLIFDATNAFIYTEVVLRLLEVLDEGRRMGWPVPRIAYYTNSSPGDTAERIYRDIYAPGKYPELWFRVGGKPLLITREEACSREVREFFQIRQSQWPNEPAQENGFPWISFVRPQQIYADRQGGNRVLSVSPAQHPGILMGDSAMYGATDNWGRSYHNGQADPRPGASAYGYNFEEQWERAFRTDPDMVFLTGWNEWTMNRLQWPPERPVRFVDNANEEYSRDIEPMAGGHGDNYYLQMTANIRRYKGYNPPVYPIKAADESRFGDPAFWEGLDPAIRPFLHHTEERNYPGFHGEYFRGCSVRNRFALLKVAAGGGRTAFYAQACKGLSPDKEGAWMRLYIGGLEDSGASEDSFGGFHLYVEDGFLYRFAEDGWEKAGVADVWRFEKALAVAVPEELLPSPVLVFKWADSRIPYDTPDDFYSKGFCAPVGRFGYAAWREVP